MWANDLWATAGGSPGNRGVHGSSSSMPKRSKIHPAARVPLSESEQVQAELLARLGRRQHREDALELLADGVDQADLHGLRVALTSSIAGDDAAKTRWGVSVGSIESARKRVRARALEDGALWIVVAWETSSWCPHQNIFLAAPGAELSNGCMAWRSGSGVDPSLVVRRHPLPVDEDLAGRPLRLLLASRRATEP